MTRILIVLGLTGTLLVAVTGCGGDTDASPTGPTYTPRTMTTSVQIAPVRSTPLEAELTFTGNLLPKRASRIVPEVEGVVDTIPQVGAQIDVTVDGKRHVEQLGITFGQSVRQDDVLVQLDRRDAEVALQLAEAKLRKAQADVAQLKAWDRPEQVRRLTAMRDEARARHEHAKLNYQRNQNLAERNATTASELEQAVMQVATMEAALEAAEATLAQAQAGPTDEELAVEMSLLAQAEAEVEQRQRDLEKTTIRAPYDGVITGFHVEVGDRVSPTGNPIAELMDLRYLVAEVAVPETYVGRVQVHDEATVATAGSPSPVPGLVTAVNDRVDPETRTFQVRVAIDNESRRFKAGQFATVQLRFGKSTSDRLVIPDSAVVFIEGEPHVFTVRDERVTARPVKLGISDGRQVEVLEGLQAGQSVVTDDPTLLSDGMTVQIRGSEPSPAVPPRAS